MLKKKILSLSLALLMVGLVVALPGLAYAKSGTVNPSQTFNCPVEPYSQLYHGTLNTKGKPYRPGSTVYCYAKNYKPGSFCYIYFDGKYVGRTTVNSSGKCYYNFALPLNCKKGIHTITCCGTYKKPGTLECKGKIRVSSKK